MRKHWKKLALVLGCSMLLVGQVPVTVHAEEAAQVVDVKAKPEVPTGVTLTDNGKISFTCQSDNTAFDIVLEKEDGGGWKEVSRIKPEIFYSKGYVVQDDFVDDFNQHGSGKYRVRVQAIMEGAGLSDWVTSNEIEFVKKQRLPKPEVVEKSMDEKKVPYIRVSELDGCVLGTDYEFEYQLVYKGMELGKSKSHGTTCDDLAPVSDKDHWVEVRAISKDASKFSSSELTKVYFYDDKPDVPSKDESAPSSSDGCSHNYEWETVTEATDTQDGRDAYKCTLCGHVKAHMEVANSAYAQFNKNAISSIDRAPANGTVTLRTNKWVSFYDDVIETLKGRPDVTVVVNYFYGGTHYTMTIPAGADLSVLTESEGYYGFRYLDTFFPGRAE